MKCCGCSRPRAVKADGTLYSHCEVCRESIRKSQEKGREKRKEYRQTPQYKKSNRINNWKRIGLIHPDYNELYEKYINTTNCERCNVVFSDDKIRTSTTRCMDHDHATGLFRNIVCNSCNVSKELRQSPAESSNILAA